MRLIIFYYNLYDTPLRAAIRDHLYSFRGDSRLETFYYNIAIRPPPSHLDEFCPDAIVFHTSLLSLRWSGPEVFWKYLERIKFVKEIKCPKLAFPQDEFFNSKLLCDFFNEFSISQIFSVSPSTEWNFIYPPGLIKGISICQVLTGYLDEKRIHKLSAKGRSSKRDLDLSYRAFNAPAWLGRHGLLKAQIAREFGSRLDDFNLKGDISLSPEDTLAGESWFKLLLRSRYTIGVEGGASLLDFDGTLTPRVQAFLQQNPLAPFEQVEKEFFPGRDGGLRLFALSPRHLEACLTRTAQILIEGDYNGILVPWKHYIPLKKDFSNLNEILKLMKDETLRSDLIENAFVDVVLSTRVRYSAFVDQVLSVLKVQPRHDTESRLRPLTNYLQDRFSELEIFGRNKIHPRIEKVIPSRLNDNLKTALKYVFKSPPSVEH